MQVSFTAKDHFVELREQHSMAWRRPGYKYTYVSLPYADVVSDKSYLGEKASIRKNVRKTDLTDRELAHFLQLGRSPSQYQGEIIVEREIPIYSQLIKIRALNAAKALKQFAIKLLKK